MSNQTEKSLRGIDGSLKFIIAAVIIVACVWLARGMFKASLAGDQRRLQESQETLERMQDQRLEHLFYGFPDVDKERVSERIEGRRLEDLIDPI